MTTDARRLMRPRAVTAKEHSIVRLLTNMAKGFALALPSVEPRVGPRPGRPYEGASRMKGNLHVRFFGGRGRATARAYPAGYGVYRERPRRGAGRVVVGKRLGPRRLQICPFALSRLLKPKGLCHYPHLFAPCLSAPTARSRKARQQRHSGHGLVEAAPVRHCGGGFTVSWQARRW
jgi:hypothetical protein